MRPELFSFDRDRAHRSMNSADGAIWPVNSFADADELNSLFEAAVQSGIIFCSDPSGFIHVYPLSISEPDPMLAVNRSSGPTLLGYSLKLRERDGEGPVDFTLRLLEETTVEANGLAESHWAASQGRGGPDEALRCFIDATRALNEAWTPAVQVEGYPPYLPSFDEFAVDVELMRLEGSAESSS